MNTNVKYTLRKIEYVERKTPEETKFKKVKKEIALQPNGKDWWTYDELKSKFGDRLETILNWEDKEFELEFKCSDLDKALREIDNLKKIDFDLEKTINIHYIGEVQVGKRVAYSPYTKKAYNNLFFYIDWKGIKTELDGINLDGIKREFKDKVRRFYEYDNPFRHEAKEELIIDDFVERDNAYAGRESDIPQIITIK